MKETIRKAKPSDASAFLEIKNQLPLKKSDGTMTRGGFLLGTDLRTYQDYIKEAYCLVAEVDTKIVGFGIVFPDSLLRQSELWERRKLAHWNIDFTPFETQQLIYFEQLAFLSGHRRLVFRLAYNLLKWAFEDGAEQLITTTVREPILNLAAVPFIEAAGGKKIAEIDEEYPKIGRIRSDIYMFSAVEFEKNTQAHKLYPFLEKYRQYFPSL